MWLRIWSWTKKYWHWILLPIGLLILLVRALQREKPTATVIVEDKTPTAAADVAIHDNETAAKVEAATQATEAEIKKIEAEHQATLDKLKDSQRLQYEEMKKKPAQEITNWLIRVGKGEE